MDSALRLLGTHSLSCKFQLGQSSTHADVDLNKKEHLCTTQLPIFETSSDDYFEVAIFLNRCFSPDLCAGLFEIEILNYLSYLTHLASLYCCKTSCVLQILTSAT